MNKNGTKLYKPGQLNGYTYCIRQIFEENTLGYTHGSGNVTKINNKCHNFSSEDQNGHLTGPSHPARLYAHPSEAPSSGRKEHRRLRKEKAALALPSEGKLKFADRLRALLKRESHLSGQLPGGLPQDPYAFSEAPAAAPPAGTAASKASPVAAPAPPEPHRSLENGTVPDLFPNHRPHPQLQAQLQQPQQHVQQQHIQHQVQQHVQQHIQQHGPQSASVKTFGSVEGKPKVTPVAAISSGASVSGGCGVAGAPKLSKTMNRLQAKIAQNKLLDKLKKAQQDSCCSSSHSQQQRVVAASSFVRDVGVCAVKQEAPAVRAAAARERVPRPRAKGSSASVAVPAPAVVAAPPVALTSSAALRNLRQVWQLEKAGLEAEDGAAAGRPHGALDLDSSDSEPSDDDESPWQRPPSFWNCDLDCSDASTVKSVRYLRIHRLRTELRKRYELLCKRQAAARPSLERQEVLVQHLAQAARLSPGRAAQLLLEGPSSSRQAQPRGGKASSLDKPTCCYHHQGGVCGQPALPYTRHCTKHIMYNVDQLLFEHCTAKFADNTQCCVPVFDMCHELPLCPEHAKKRDNYNKMASEPKPKKPRKKSKPPALTRPPKRGKKKSKQRPPGCSPFPYLSLETSSSLFLQQQQRPLSPASSPSSSSSPCSSRSPPFLGSCEAAHAPSSMADIKPLLLQDLLPQPHDRLHMHQQPKPHPQLHLMQQQPHLQLQPRAAGLGLVVRVKTEPKPVVTAAATTTPMTTQAHVAPHPPVAASLVASAPAPAAVAVATTLSSTTLGASPGVEDYGYVAPTSTGMNPETTAKELVERIEPDLTSDLENQFSPDTIEKSLELPLDAAELANQATKLLEEHDFTEVLNKISDDAFSDFFAESKNGEYVPSKEETEELERALAAVSKDVHLARESLAKLSGSSSAEVPDLPDLVDAFPDLPLSSSDLTSLTQALMGNTPEVLRTVALLSSDLHASSSPHQPEGFAPMEAQQGVSASPGSATVFVPTSGGTAEVAASWLLGTVGQDFGGTGVGSGHGAGATPAGASSSQVGLPKQSVLAQESVS